MNWPDMDYEERLQAVYQGTRDGLLAKQIAFNCGTTPKTVVDFARAEDLQIRTRIPGLKLVRVRKGKSKLSPQSTQPTQTRTNAGFTETILLAERREKAHSGT